MPEIRHPAIADGVGDGFGQCRVCQQQPTPWCHAIGLVVEALGEHLGQVFDRRRLQQPGVNRGDAVCAVRADDRQSGHTNLALSGFLDHARAANSLLVARKARANCVEKAAIDLVDDIQMARQQRLEPGERPFFQRLGQQCMIGVGQSSLRQIPRLIPPEMPIVEQDPHQFRNRHRRMGIVELNCYVIRKCAPIGVAFTEAPHQIGERASHQKVLLDKAQRLPQGCRIVGIQHAGQGLGGESSGESCREITAAEFLKIEIAGSSGGPQPQGVDVLAAIARYGTIERDTDHGRRPARDGAQGPSLQFERAVEPDLHRFVRPRDLPRVATTQPVIRLLLLPAVQDGLLEHAVLVAQSITHRRQLHRRHRIEKARREPPEPAIAETGIGLLLEQAQPIEAPAIGCTLDERIEQQVGDVVGERPADQKLHRQIIDPLRIGPPVGAFGQDPTLGQHIPDRAGDRLEALPRPGRVRSDDVVEEQVALIQSVAVAAEADRTAAVLLEKVRH